MATQWHEVGRKGWADKKREILTMEKNDVLWE